MSSDLAGRMSKLLTDTFAKLIPREHPIALVGFPETANCGDHATWLGEKRLLQSEADWDFLSSYMLVANQNWFRFLGDQRRLAVEQDEALEAAVENAHNMLRELSLDQATLGSQPGQYGFGPR